MNIPEFKPMPFLQWREQNKDVNNEIECDECDGTGYVTCSHCGSEIECDECDGTGIVKGGTKALYVALVSKQRRAYERYYGLPYSETDREYQSNTRALYDDADDKQHHRPLVLTVRA